MEELQVIDDTRYVQRSKGVILAEDRNALHEYRKSSKANRQRQKEINTLRSDVDKLKNSVSGLESKIDQILSIITGDSE